MSKVATDRFPWDPSSDRVLALATELDPADHSRTAEYVREVAGSVRDHRAAAAAQHPATPLTKQARDTIKNWSWDPAYRVTIAGYTRHFFPDGKWHGDRCGCIDDRCIGFHHDNEDDCHCLEPCLDMYVEAIRAGAR